MSPKEQLLELASLTQLFLLQEYNIKERLFANTRDFNYFKETATMPKPAPVIPIPAQEPVAKPVAAAQAAPVPAPMPEEKKISSPEELFALEPLGKPQGADLSDMRKLVSEKLPKLEIVDLIPHKKSQRLATPVAVIATAAETLLLTIGKAISEKLVPTVIVDPQDLTEEDLTSAQHLRLILLSNETLQANKQLKQLYRAGSGALGVVGKTPALVLYDTAALAQDPQRKRDLWNTLKGLLSP